MFFKEPSLSYLFIIGGTFFCLKKSFVKQKHSSDVKGTLWNYLDKTVILWHREAPLFLRVHVVILFYLILFLLLFVFNYFVLIVFSLFDMLLFVLFFYSVILF